jgi:hypothetical protein
MTPRQLADNRWRNRAETNRESGVGGGVVLCAGIDARTAHTAEPSLTRQQSQSRQHHKEGTA